MIGFLAEEDARHDAESEAEERRDDQVHRLAAVECVLPHCFDRVAVAAPAVDDASIRAAAQAVCSRAIATRLPVAFIVMVLDHLPADRER